MEKYRGELSDDVEVTWLDDAEEMKISDGWLMSLESLPMGGVASNYVIVKDFCKSHKMDYLEVFRVCKLMVSELNKKEK